MTITHPYQGHYMQDAFLGFVSFASKELVEQYEDECGLLKLGSTPMDKMIDKTTGHDEFEVQRFIDWCVVQFGPPEQIEETL